MSTAALRRTGSIALVALLVSAPVSLGQPGAHAAGRSTVSTSVRDPIITAARLIDSVGVNVHMGFDGTAYDAAARVVAMLHGLGVHAVRDRVEAQNSSAMTALIRLGRAGIKLNLVFPGASNTPTQSVDPTQLAKLKQLAPYVDGVEPPNEYDCTGDPSWKKHLKQFDELLSRKLKADPVLARLPLLGPAFCDPASVDSYGRLGSTGDVANGHLYPGGDAPEPNLDERAPGVSAAQGSSLPMRITETGYTNALNPANSDSDPGQAPVTKDTAADYDVRTILEAARLGVARTYFYEFLDESSDPRNLDRQQHYGLVNHDGTPKPAYTAIKSLLADVAHPPITSAAVSSTAVSLRVTGGNSAMHELTIADPSGGGRTIALWTDKSVEDTKTHAAVPDESRSVRVTASARSQAVARQPSRGNASRSLGRGRSFVIAVGDAVTLVHVSPLSKHGSGRTTTSPTGPGGSTGRPTSPSSPSLPGGGVVIGGDGVGGNGAGADGVGGHGVGADGVGGNDVGVALPRGIDAGRAGHPGGSGSLPAGVLLGLLSATGLGGVAAARRHRRRQNPHHS